MMEKRAQCVRRKSNGRRRRRLHDVTNSAAADDVIDDVNRDTRASETVGEFFDTKVNYKREARRLLFWL